MPTRVSIAECTDTRRRPVWQRTRRADRRPNAIVANGCVFPRSAENSRRRGLRSCWRFAVHGWARPGLWASGRRSGPSPATWAEHSSNKPTPLPGALAAAISFSRCALDRYPKPGTASLINVPRQPVRGGDLCHRPGRRARVSPVSSTRRRTPAHQQMQSRVIGVESYVGIKDPSGASQPLRARPAGGLSVPSRRTVASAL